jgi:hypothetical protein
MNRTLVALLCATLLGACQSAEDVALWEEMIDDAALARSVTVTIADASIRGDYSEVEYSLNGRSIEMDLVGECHKQADILSDGDGEALKGCELTCNAFNEDEECTDCDIDCSDVPPEEPPDKQALTTRR